MSKILLIEEDPKWQAHFKDALIPPHDLKLLPDGKDVSSVLNREEFEVILLSLQLRSADWRDTVARIKAVNAYTPIIVLNESEETRLIVEAIQAGAFDFIAKPSSREKMLLSIRRAIENRLLKDEIDYLRSEQRVVYDFDRIVAESPSIKKVIKTLKKFAQTDSTILITGETGTGKSFLSGAVHFNSSRRDKSFIKINCANIPETLLESELFGHEKGAFTGANKTRVGRLEQGRGGTVFLDEIGEMNLALQAKLLRVLEDKSFERVGGNKTIHSDVRIIAATNRKPEQLVAERKFRGDLYYRLNVLRVHLPPLREREDCIVPLAHELLNNTRCKIKENVRIKGFSQESMQTLLAYSWPGNIRQLANTIERAAILEESNMIRPENIILPELIAENSPVQIEDIASGNSLQEQERETIVRALEKSLWVQKEAANLLGITPRTLNYKIKKLGITHQRWRKNR